MKIKLLSILLALAATSANAAIISYDLMGLGGSGLLGTNERPSPIAIAGTGGELGAGITFDTDTNVLTINIGWGSANGYTDLTSNVSNAHIHGPVAGTTLTDFMTNAAGVPSGFGIFASVPAVTSPSAGVISVTRTFTATQATQLAEGRFYINIHTVNNGGGEIRANLVPVPEPGVSALALSCLGLALASRRRK